MLRPFGFLFGIFMLCLVATLQGQTPIAALQQAAAKFHALESYTATIGYSMGKEHDMGKVYCAGNRYRTDFPEDQTIFDGKSVMNYAMGFGAVTISEPSNAVDYSLLGMYDLHRFGYDFAWADTMFAVQHMQLTATDDALSGNKILIGIAKKSGRITEYSIEFRNGLRIEYVVIEDAINPVLQPDLFKIDWDFVRKAENGEIAPTEHDH